MKDPRFNKYLHSVKDWFRTIGSDCSSGSYMRNVLPQAIGQGPKKFGHTYKARIDYSAIVRPSDRVRGCGTAQFGLTRTITHNRQNPAQYWKISWKFKLNQVFLLISKISRKLLGYLPSKTNEKSIAFSSNSSGAYKNNKALSIARAVLGTSHVHIEYCVVMQRSVGYWGSSYPICGNCFTNNKSELFTGIW